MVCWSSRVKSGRFLLLGKGLAFSVKQHLTFPLEPGWGLGWFWSQSYNSMRFGVTTTSVTWLTSPHTSFPLCSSKPTKNCQPCPGIALMGTDLSSQEPKTWKEAQFLVFPSFRAPFQSRFLLCKAQFINDKPSKASMWKEKHLFRGCCSM